MYLKRLNEPENDENTSILYIHIYDFSYSITKFTDKLENNVFVYNKLIIQQ